MFAALGRSLKSQGQCPLFSCILVPSLLWAVLRSGGDGAQQPARKVPFFEARAVSPGEPRGPADGSSSAGKGGGGDDRAAPGWGLRRGLPGTDRAS